MERFGYRTSIGLGVTIAVITSAITGKWGDLVVVGWVGVILSLIVAAISEWLIDCHRWGLRAVLILLLVVTCTVVTGALHSDEHKWSVRVGAICSDGWHSSATGSGACSWHGGVREWLTVERVKHFEGRERWSNFIWGNWYWLGVLATLLIVTVNHFVDRRATAQGSGVV